MTDIAAALACLILISLAIFQLLLALGFPLGKFAWGGAHKALPSKLRAASLLSIVLYTVFAVFILEKADIIQLINAKFVTETAMWILTTYFFIGIVMNSISRSKGERLVMTPLATVLAFLFLYVTLTA